MNRTFEQITLDEFMLAFPNFAGIDMESETRYGYQNDENNIQTD